MKKRIAFRKLGRTPAHKWSMLRNQVSSLIEQERIVTTEAKAKELRHLADHVISLAKRGLAPQNATNQTTTNSPQELHNRRRAAAIVRGPWNVSKLFDVLGPRYQHRDGGYTRVLKLSKPRAGDNAPMAVIEYVDRPGEIRAARPPSTFQKQVRGNVSISALEDTLRKMGIPPINELLTIEEQEELNNQIKKQEK